MLRLPERGLLLAGTALVSSLAVTAPAPVSAQVAVFRPFSPFPVAVTNNRNCIAPGTCALINTILPGAFIDLTNRGDFATFGIGASAIFTNTNFGFSPITITNSGDLATLGVMARGISATTAGRRSPISIVNSGEIATLGFLAHGLYGVTTGNNSPISIVNSGSIATMGFNADGVFAVTEGRNSLLSIVNSGAIATRGREAEGINAETKAANSHLSIVTSGDIQTAGMRAEGIYATTRGGGSNLDIVNSGRIATRGRFSEGIDAFGYGVDNDIRIVNSGEITTTGFFSEGIFAGTSAPGSSLTIENSGIIRANGGRGYGIAAVSGGPSSPIVIKNSGDVFGSTTGIYTYSGTSATIFNTGSISAGRGPVIDTEGAGSSIYNAGLISGFVDLTDRRDRFINRPGGEFNAMDTSDFGGGNDLFVNEARATLRAASEFNNGEETNFVGLERFVNKGVITMVDGRNNDVFRISNTPGGTDATFSGSGNSTLAVDAFLGGPGSTADNLIIDGNVSGRTRIAVNNTNQSSARFHPVGIPVVFAEGKVNAKNFFIDQPIDAGFFEYDLFFKPTGSGFFELKNHTGGGSHILPHLVTVTHETFHNTTETWFDQSTDLRVLLAQGALCSGRPPAEDEARCQQLYNFTPGVWARGAGNWFELQDTATTRANGRTYHHNLDRNFDIWTIESGMDFGKRDLFADGDVLVFGVLGGAVEATLNYQAIARNFGLSALEAGAYATYLRGGLFVDTLFKTIFGEIDPKELRGFPDTLDTTTYGFRADTGYRFGGFRQGPFIEPLATIAVSWTHVDDFALDGNTVDFDDNENVRGRVGLRVGTNTEIWEGTMMEPFVVGSLWGTLSGAHHATLTSTGRVFDFTDEPEDLWGVVSAGVNFFNPGAQTAVFAKLDYTFGDETQGVGVRGGMRYNW